MEVQPYAVKMQRDMIHEIEASKPEYVVQVNISESWLVHPFSATEIIDWWLNYAPEHYAKVGIADILSLDKSEYRWDQEALGYHAQSRNTILLYKRIPQSKPNQTNPSE